MLRQVAPLRCRQMIASIVRRRSWCSVLPRGRTASISGASRFLDQRRQPLPLRLAQDPRRASISHAPNMGTELKD
jgi:hypothetical protein